MSSWNQNRGRGPAFRRRTRASANERLRYSDYVESLLRRKLATGKLATPSSRRGCIDTQQLHLLPAFGDCYLDAIKRIDIEEWKAMQAGSLVSRHGGAPTRISPHTVNQRLRVLLSTLRAAVGELDLAYDPTHAVEPLDTSSDETFTEEEPNSLTVDELRAFMSEARVMYPQHFAMLALGVATGRRPSELRPLRRSGATPDILWNDGVMLVRQSQTLGGVVTKTKTGRRLRIPLPDDLMTILAWHVEQLPAGVMRESQLLFPSTTGHWRSPTCLDKPIRRIAKAAGIKKHLSAKFMRRTFQDLGRAADVHDLVVRAISGHTTSHMQAHYSSVAPTEVREGLAKVVALAGFREALG
jgi:integrase